MSDVNFPRFHRCLHPYIGLSKVTGEKVLYNCGKCAACRLSRSSELNKLATLEESSHRYCRMFCLHYDDEHVPLMKLVYDDSRLQSDKVVKWSAFDVVTGEELNGFELDEGVSLWNDVIPNTRLVNGFVPYLRKKDLQLFIQAVRDSFLEMDEETGRRYRSAEIRYLAAAEYGPCSFRPHYHVLFYFDSPEVNDKISEVVRKVWKFGDFSDDGQSRGYTGDYVAGYLTHDNSSCVVYASKAVRQFHLHSKHFGEKVTSQILSDACPPEPGKIDAFAYVRNGVLVRSRPPRSYICSLFPKCFRFYALNTSQRLSAYLFKTFIDEYYKTEELTTLQAVHRFLMDSKNLSPVRLAYLNIFDVDIPPVGLRKQAYMDYLQGDKNGEIPGYYIPYDDEEVTWKLFDNKRTNPRYVIYLRRLFVAYNTSNLFLRVVSRYAEYLSSPVAYYRTGFKASKLAYIRIIEDYYQKVDYWTLRDNLRDEETDSASFDADVVQSLFYPDLNTDEVGKSYYDVLSSYPSFLGYRVSCLSRVSNHVKKLKLNDRGVNYMRRHYFECKNQRVGLKY